MIFSSEQRYPGFEQLGVDLYAVIGGRFCRTLPILYLFLFIVICYLRIGSCLACVYRVMDARGKFGEHERSVRVARGDSRE